MSTLRLAIYPVARAKMFAAANAAVVPGKVTDTVAGLAWTVATRTLGMKSRACSAVAVTCSCCEIFPHTPNERPAASSKNPPSANSRPPHRRRAHRRCFTGLSISRSTAGLSRRSRPIASYRSRTPRSFIGEILEYAIGRDAVIALAQHGKQIRDDEQGGGSGKQQAADHRARQRRVLLLAGAADRHRDHADDHRRGRHQHRAYPGSAGVEGGPERAPAFELLLARKRHQQNGIRRGDANRHDRAH